MGFSFGITNWRWAYDVANDDETGERSEMYQQLQNEVRYPNHQWTLPSGKEIDWAALLSLSGGSAYTPHYSFPYSVAGLAVQSALETLSMPGGTFVDVLPFEAPDEPPEVGGFRLYAFSTTFRGMEWAGMTTSHVLWGWDRLPASFQREVEESFARHDISSDIHTLQWKWAVGAFVDLARASLEAGLPVRLQW